VKTVIESGFQVCREMGLNYVGSEHLLIGLVREAEGLQLKRSPDIHVDEARIREALELLPPDAEEPAPARRQPDGEPDPIPAVKHLVQLFMELRHLGMDVSRVNTCFWRWHVIKTEPPAGF
jgi:hypothetical protein